MKKIFLILPALLFQAFFFSCSTVPEIPENASATQLIQYGQDAIDLGNYSLAETYYLTTIKRYGMDTTTYIEARYELGRLYLKKEKWNKAFLQFKESLDIDDSVEIGTYPPSFQKLSKLSINQIPEKYRN